MLKKWIIYNTIILQEAVFMAVQIKSDRKETENKTVRFPVEMISRIQKIMQEKDVSFTGFVLQACEYVLDELDKEDKHK